VYAALRAKSRPVYQIYVNRDRMPPGIGRVLDLAERQNVPVGYLSLGEIDDMASGHSHGGTIALAGERRCVDLDELFVPAGTPFLVMLDGVEDPYNFGQAVRSLYAAGATGLILKPRNWMSAAGVVARASAGASELLRCAVAETVSSAAESCAAAGVSVVALDEDGDRSIFESDLTVPVMLLIGGEQRGITRSFLRAGFAAVRIPKARPDARALGTAASAAVAGFEVMRQRTQSTGG
jgi:23S rRNA (guanosine2251-2'-O)-methyltransferase